MFADFLKIKKQFCLVVVGLFMFSLSALADDNIISSVVISKAKDKQNAYELNIDSTKPVEYKVNNEDDSMVWFDLKNSILAEDAGTVYDDVVNIDNVVVKQIDRNKVRIYVKGSNVKNTELVFVNSLFETKEQPKKIVINRPISAYKSIEEKDVSGDLESQDEIQDWDDNSFNFSHLLTELMSGAKKELATVLSMFLIGFLLIILSIKGVIKKISQDTEPLIGLNHAKEHDIKNMYSEEARKPIPKQIKTGDIDFENIANKNKILKEAQEQLSKAHSKYQAYLKNKYKNNIPPKTNSDIIARGIALNQYKKSNQNPYLDQEVIKMNTVLSNNLSNSKGNFQIPPRPRKDSNVTKTSSPYVQKISKNISNPVIKSENQNNLKFLESVTKIYEQSGREDLAQGLKNSITKTKQKI